MKNLKSRRGFTLIELVITIVIAGILALVAIVAFQALINQSREKSIETTAQTFDKEFQALTAFEQPLNPANAGRLILAASTDLPASITISTQGGTHVAGTPVVVSWNSGGALPVVGSGASDVLATATRVHLNDGQKEACLTLAAPGTSVQGRIAVNVSAADCMDS